MSLSQTTTLTAAETCTGATRNQIDPVHSAGPPADRSHAQRFCVHCKVAVDRGDRGLWLDRTLEVGS